ncbi:MAG TPA: ribbon-helix-helix domain-containing protein [Chloroflexota bacterium]|nr:ribbon-helix-helix domain-containing protein [Chloroflexota bacterium]
MATGTSTTSVRIPDDLLDRFDRLTKATARTRSYHIIRALEAYIAEQEYLVDLFSAAAAEADSDPTAVTNADATAMAIEAGLLRPEDLEGTDPVSADEYEAAQERSVAWT